MSKKYDVSIYEIADFLCKYDLLSETPKGFSDAQIQEAEKRLNITLPASYKKYLSLYGQNTINDKFNHINAPAEIICSYDMIDEILEDDKEFFESASSEKEKNEYYPFFKLPKEQWHTITENYVLIWYENQGCWNAGYLKQDLLNGVSDPPVYISTQDDFITFEKICENTEEFLTEMLFFSAWEIGFDCYQEHTSIINFIQKEGLDQYKICQKGTHTCIDTKNNQLYFYSSMHDGNEVLLVSEEECDEDEQ